MRRRKNHKLFNKFQKLRKKFLKHVHHGLSPFQGIRKEIVMKMTTYRPNGGSVLSAVRGLAAIALFGSLGLFAACGGGGGGGETVAATSPPVVVAPPGPTVAPAAKGTLSVTPASQRAGEGKGSAAVTLVPKDVANASSLTIETPDGTKVPAAQGTTLEQMVPLGASTFTLRAGDGTVLDTKVATLSCMDGLSEVNKVCVAPAVTPPSTMVYYQNFILEVGGGVISDTGNGTLGVGYPQVIDLVAMKRVPLKNETGYQVGDCRLPKVGQLLPLTGLIPVACTLPSNGNVTKLFPVDPIRRVLMSEYTGVIPDTWEFYRSAYGELGSGKYVANGVGREGMYVDDPLGVVYYTNDDIFTLLFTRDGFLTHATIAKADKHDGTGSVGVLISYSNKAPPGN